MRGAKKPAGTRPQRVASLVQEELGPPLRGKRARRLPEICWRPANATLTVGAAGGAARVTKRLTDGSRR